MMSSRDQIRRYYLLCTVALGGKAHLIDGLPRDKLSIIFTKKELDLYLREANGGSGSTLIARETIVGGDDVSVIVIG